MKKYLLGLITGLIICTTVGVIAYNITAQDINYRTGTVKDALDSLYDIEATQVATLTTRGATYTMQHDGYIIGTASGDGSKVAELHLTDYNNDFHILSTALVRNFDVSIFVQSGETVTTRTDGGSYNLTVYEWK